jgi:thioredoxin 1
MTRPAHAVVRLTRILVLAGIFSALMLPGCGSESSKTVTLTTSNFDTQVLQSKKPVLIDFWGDGCVPCERMAPVIKELAADYEGRAVVAKVNTSDYPEIATKYEISVIPTFLVFKDGQVKKRLEGMQAKHVLANLLGAMQ